MSDQDERARRHKVDKPKLSSQHPIAALEKRVIDSPAFADVSFSARAVLLLLCRNLEKGLNGHIQLSEKQAAENGIERKTLRRALADLLAHQLIAMTRRGGKVQGQCNRFALTWLPVKSRAGIHAGHFKLDAWRSWKAPEGEKTGYRKCPPDSAQNVPLMPNHSPKMSLTPGDKKGLIEVVPIRGTVAAPPPTATASAWMADDLARLEAAGLAGWQCYQIPLTSTARIPARASRHH